MSKAKLNPLSQRTADFIDAYFQHGVSATLGKVDIQKAPWHEGYANKHLQETAMIDRSQFKKGMPLAGCGVWEYAVPFTLSNNANALGVTHSFEIKKSKLKKDIPKEYASSANYAVDMDALKNKYGESWTNVYYNLKDNAAIQNQPENVRKKSFERFIKSQVKEVSKMFANRSEEFREDITSALTEQLKSDFTSNEYLNYAEDVIGYFPGGVALQEKAKEHIKEYNDDKKVRAGLTDNAIQIAMGGSSKGKFQKDAGLFVVEFADKNPEANGQSKIGKLLMDNISDITDYAENLIGTPEGSMEQKIFVSKDVQDGDKNKVVVLYRGLESENPGEVEAAVQQAVKDCIENNTTLRTYNDDFVLGDVHQALSSQVSNAVERYSENTGTWISPKSLKKSIVVNQQSAQLDNSLLNEESIENQNDGPEF